jgi:2-methylisocitrate lyase-like PEP mutase family enzyme
MMKRKTSRREFVRLAGLATAGWMAVRPADAQSVPASQARPAARTMGARFRELLLGTEPFPCPAAYDVPSARLIEMHGFQAVFVGSSSANLGLLALPDQAVVTVSEIINFDGIIASNVDIPVVADLDDFGATPLNVYRFAKEADRRGIGAAAFDDRMPLNRATGYAAPGVQPKDRMVDNIHAAADARTDMVLIARCLAPTPNGSTDELYDRAMAYAEAGADAVWLAFPTPQDSLRAAGMIRKPLWGTVGSQNFPATVAAMKAAGIMSGDAGGLVPIALGAVDKALAEMKTTGRLTEAAKGSLNQEGYAKVTQAEELNARARKYHLPAAGSAPER